jgi:hypothetical protein
LESRVGYETMAFANATRAINLKDFKEIFMHPDILLYH